MKSKVLFRCRRGEGAGRDPGRQGQRTYLATGLNDKVAEGDFAALEIHFGEAGDTGYVRSPSGLPASSGDPDEDPARLP